jgi:hypothetical protein
MECDGRVLLKSLEFDNLDTTFNILVSLLEIFDQNDRLIEACATI